MVKKETGSPTPMVKVGLDDTYGKELPEVIG